MYRHFVVIVLGVCAFVAGCASAPTTPYWSDAQWINELGARVQTDLAESSAVADTSHQVTTVAVGFRYDGGRLKDVQLLQSTGSAALDDAVQAAVAQVKPPQAHGPWSGTPHRFALALYVGRGWAALTAGIHRDIQQHVNYPLVAMLNGAGGVVVARFDYLNGRALDPHVTQSSGDADIDASVLEELRALRLPPAPAELRDRRLTFQSTICFNGQTLRCPRSAQAVYFVANTVGAQPCSQVSFRYQEGKITQVRLAKATQYPALDQLAVQLVTQGEFPSPAGGVASGGSFMLPVCYTFNMSPPHGPSGPGERNPMRNDPRASRTLGRPLRLSLADAGRTRL